jgi:CheY-like chemotaxis protein
MKALYLEDNMNDARFMSLYFATTHHRLRHVLDIEEAEAVLAHESDFDLLMIDMMAGQGHDGFSFIKTLRAKGLEKAIVAVTSLVTPQDRDACLQNGVNHILQKPFRITLLAQLIQEISANI